MKTIFDKPLIDIPPAHPDMPDPVHNERDLWLGIDRATGYLGFSLEDVALIFRHSRPAAIMGFARLGADLNASRDVPTNIGGLNAILGCLRGLLREAKE